MNWTVEIDNLTFLQALAYMNKNGCCWRELPTNLSAKAGEAAQQKFIWSLPIIAVSRQVLRQMPPKDICNRKPLLMDKAYEGNACRKKARKCKMKPVVPPKKNRRYKWKYDKELYKHRNIVERYFCQIKEFRRRYTRYDKLDETDNAFIALANIAIYLRS